MSGFNLAVPQSSVQGNIAPMTHLPGFPQRIVCLTEETTETLYLLEEDWRIVGISGFTVRPPAGTQGEAAGLGIYQRQNRPHRRAATGSRPGLLRPAGRYCGRAGA